MPSYDFLNTKTNEIEEHKMSHTVLDAFKEENPHLQQHFVAKNLPVFSDAGRMSVPGTMKADSTFEKYVINRIKEQVPGNTLKAGHKTKMNREW
jgi:hypothetical protein